MNRLPPEIILKISGYYPSPELTPTNVCDIKIEIKNRKIELVKKMIRKILDNIIEDIVYL